VNPQSTAQSNPSPSPYKVLIAVAFDATAESALHEGIRLASERPGAELHVVHVVSNAGYLTPEDLLTAADRGLAEAPALLRERIERVWQSSSEIQVGGHIRPGPPAETILQVAIDISADVIVLGTHARKGLQKLLIGSVAEQVLRGAHCPVLVAVAKNYSDAIASGRIEPACQECLTIRKETADATFWCQRHSKVYLHTHIYIPRDEHRNSVMPTY
jgi:nucleotide-binding universal stress UspA family protein